MGKPSRSHLSASEGLKLDDALRQHYLYPEGAVSLQPKGDARNIGFFRFGQASCFGACAEAGTGEISCRSDATFPQVDAEIHRESGVVLVPFDPGEIADNLRLERYMGVLTERSRTLNSVWVRQAYYLARKFMPVSVRKHLQRLHLADWHRLTFPRWPLDSSVDSLFEHILGLAIRARGGDSIPFIWFWPNGHMGCMIMTHDVETAAGRDYCSTVMDMEDSVGLRSSFQIVPEVRYRVPSRFLEELRGRGYEINIHDLNHDGLLFHDRAEFERRAKKINKYAEEFGAKGFRSAVLYRNLEWYDELSFEYDMSVPNVGHLDPQRGGCCTVLPYFVGSVLELPLTTVQDYSLLHILQDRSCRIWEEQMQLIQAHHGLLSFNVHPDYIMDERGRELYACLLSRLRSLRVERDLWAPLPGAVNSWWRERSQMQLISDGGKWRIVGAGSERARVAYAALDGDHLAYRLTN